MKELFEILYNTSLEEVVLVGTKKDALKLACEWLEIESLDETVFSDIKFDLVLGFHLLNDPTFFSDEEKLKLNCIKKLLSFGLFDCILFDTAVIAVVLDPNLSYNYNFNF
jgi:hypothetical protein